MGTTGRVGGQVRTQGGYELGAAVGGQVSTRKGIDGVRVPYLGLCTWLLDLLSDMPIVTETTATPPPSSKDTSSIDLDMLFADRWSYIAFLLQFIVIHTNYSY